MAEQKTKGVKFTTPIGRFSFPALFTPKKKYYPPGTEPANPDYEYSTQFLFDENTDLKAFNAKIDDAIAEVFGKNKATWPKNISRPLIDQEVLIEKAIEKGYGHDHLIPGAMYMTAKTNAKKSKPIIVDADMNEVIDPTIIYGGAYGKLSGQMKVHVIKGKDLVTKKEVVSVYVTPYLHGVQFIKGGDSFGGRSNAAEMFEPVTFEENESLGNNILG